MSLRRDLQLGLLEGTDRPVTPLIPSVIAARTNAELVRLIAPLYLTGSVLDVTYGKGGWWEKYRPCPFASHDLAVDGVDFRQLPEATSSWDAVCFDPPYILRNGKSAHPFQTRYGLEHTVPADFWQMIRDGIEESARVARRWLLVKCGDFTNGGELQLGSYRVLGWADALGLRVHDLIVHNAGPGPGNNDRTKVQIRSRRHHSYLIVFRMWP